MIGRGVISTVLRLVFSVCGAPATRAKYSGLLTGRVGGHRGYVVMKAWSCSRTDGSGRGGKKKKSWFAFDSQLSDLFFAVQVLLDVSIFKVQWVKSKEIVLSR